jgi:periplasmic protein TonB
VAVLLRTFLPLLKKPPAYKGGDSALLRFIGENTIYPQKAKDNNITGRVIVTFVLMKDGSIQGIDLYQRVHHILDLEAIRVVNSIPKDKWIPAEINGEKVNTAYLIPITFRLTR